MRWLIVHPGPNFSVADVYTGWVEALEALGEQVQTFCLDRRLTFYDAALLETGYFDDDGHAQVRKAVSHKDAIEMAADGLLSHCYRWWPDVILIVSSFFIPEFVLEVMQSRRHKIVMLYTESPYQDEMQLKTAEYATISLLNDPLNISKYQIVCPSFYVPHAFRPKLHHPGPAKPDLACDLGFVGTGFPSRLEFFKAMDLEGLDVLLAGNWAGLPDESPLRKYLAHEPDKCLDNEQTADVYRSSRAGINIYRRESEDEHAGEGWAMGPREVEMAASGLFYLRDPRPEGDELFPMLPKFSGPEDASQQLRWYLAHEKERKTAARKARQAVQGRTFDSNARELLRRIDELPRTMRE